MQKLVLVFTVFIFYGCSSEGLFKKIINNFHTNGAPLIKFVEKQGYKLEEHRFETEDGYTLTYHRLWPAGVKLGERWRGCPVLLQHGLASNSAAFLIPDRNALGYFLADAGYDVWLANNRGNRISHTRKSNFSTNVEGLGLHELGTLDLAAGLDGVLGMTRRPRVAVVAHSHGVAEVLALVSSRPSYQAKLSVVLALAPAVLLGPGHLRLAEAYRIFINNAIKRSSEIVNESPQFPPGLEEKVCKSSEPCLQTLRLLRGTIPTNAWEVIKEFQPSGASRETLQEVLQQIQQGPVFKHFDFGPSKNVKIYQSETPPMYDLPNVQTPIHIYYSLSDVFITKEDVRALAVALPHVTLHSVQEKHFNHFDFLWSPLASQLVYSSIKDKLKLCAQKESHFQTNQPLPHYFERAMVSSPNGQLFDASLKFVRSLESLYGAQNIIDLHVFARLSQAPHNEGITQHYNGEKMFGLDIRSKQHVDIDDIQFIYEQFKILTNYSQMINMLYNVNIKMTHDDLIEVIGFDELWKQVFLMYRCSGNKQAICDVLNTLREYRSLLTRPYLQIFSPARLLKTKTHFFQTELGKILRQFQNKENIDLSLNSVTNVIKRMQGNVPEMRLFVVAMNDIYNLFVKLSSQRIFIDQHFDVSIKGNASLGLEIINYHVLQNIDYSQSNCTFQCEEIQSIIENLNIYKSVLNNRTIKIDNPKMYIGPDIWSVLIKANDANYYPSVSMWKENVNKVNGKETLNDIGLRNMFQKLKRYGNIYLTQKEVDVLLYSAEYKEPQKELLKNALYDIYESFQTLNIYNTYISDRYKVMITEDFFQQISVDNFEELWNKIFHSTTLCRDECLVIRKSLENIKTLKTLLSSNLIIIDNPKNYISQGIKEINGTEIPTSTDDYNTSKESSNSSEADVSINDIEAFLLRVKEMFSRNPEIVPYDQYDKQMENNINSNFNIFEDTHVSGNNRNSTLNVNGGHSRETNRPENYLPKYESFQNSSFNLNSSNPVEKDIVNIENLLKDLKVTKETCVGKCKSKENLMKKACKFQKHLYSTYLKDERKDQPLYCEILLKNNSSFKLDNRYVNGAGRKPDSPQQQENYLNYDVIRDILQLNRGPGIVDLTENSIKTLYNAFKKDKTKIESAESIIFNVYDILQSLTQYKDYLKTEYSISVTYIGPSTISIDYLDFDIFWNLIQGREDCNKECKEVSFILNKLQPYKDLFGKGGLIIDKPHKFSETTSSSFLRTGNDYENSNGESKVSLTSDKSLDAFLKQLEKYQTHIKSTYDSASSNHFTEEANNIRSVISNLNKTKEVCKGDCPQMRDLYTIVCKFQKNLYSTYLDPIFRDNSIFCNYFTNKNTSHLIQTREFGGNMEHSNNNNFSKTLVSSSLFHISELKDIANLTEQSITQHFKRLYNDETEMNQHIRVLHNIYDAIQSLLPYKEYLRTMYNVSVAKIEPSTVYINQFNKLWILLQADKHCREPCMSIKSILAKLRTYEDLYSKSVIIIENPYYYIHQTSTKTDGSYNNEYRFVDNATAPPNPESIIQGAIKSLKWYQIFIKNTYSTISSEQVLKDIGEINSLLNRLENTKGQCVGSCNEQLELIMEVCRFQKHLLDAYSNENILEPNFNVYCESMKLNNTIYADINYNVDRKFENNSIQSNDVIETGNVLDDNDVLWVIFHSNKDRNIVNLTGEAIDNLYKQFEKDTLKIEKLKSIIFNLYEVLNRLWAYKDFIQSTYGISVTKNEETTISIDNFNYLWNSIHDKSKLCNTQCNQLKPILDQLINSTEIVPKIYIAVADPRRQQYSNSIQIVNPNSDKYETVNQDFNTTFNETYSQTVKEETDPITKRLRKYLENLYSTYGIGTSTSVTRDIVGIEQFLDQINETKDKSTASSKSTTDLIQRVRRFLKHLDKTYLNKDNVNSVSDLSAFNNLNAIGTQNFNFFELFHYDKNKQSIDLTSKWIEKLLHRENTNIEVVLSTLNDLYEAFYKLLTYKSYISSVYKATIKWDGNSKIIVHHIDNLFNISIQSNDKCNTTCLEVLSLLKSIGKYKDYLSTNSLEIENPATYIDNHFWELMKQTNTQIGTDENTKPPNNFPETNTNTNFVSNSDIEKYDSNTNLWSPLRVNGNASNIDLSASTVQKVLSQTSTNQSTKKYFLDGIVHIYGSLKKLINYKSYLEKNYDVSISMNDKYSIRISNVNQLLNALYNNKSVCSDKCIEIRQIMNIIKQYHSLINTKLIIIDNPMLYWNLNEYQAQQNGHLEGLGELHTSITESGKRNDEENTVSVYNSKELDNIIERLKKYLVSVKSQYGPAVVAAQGDLIGLSEVLRRVDNERAKCLGNHCNIVEQLLKEAEQFQNRVNETYSNVYRITRKPNENIYEIVEKNYTLSVFESHLWSLLNPDSNVLDLSMNTVKERVIQDGSVIGQKELLTFSDTVYEIYKLLLKLEPYKDYLRQTYDVAIFKTPQSKITVYHLKNIFYDTSLKPTCIDICLTVEHILKELSLYREILLQNEKIEIDNPNSYIDRKSGSFVNTNHESSNANVDSVDIQMINMRLINDLINNLTSYLNVINMLTVSSSLPQHSQDFNRVKLFLDKLKDVQIQGNNSKDIESLLMDVQRFQTYLKIAYPSSHNYYSPFNSTLLKPNFEPNGEVNSVVWALIRGNGSSEVLDLTKGALENNLKRMQEDEHVYNEFSMVIFDIYEILQKLIIHQDYLRTVYNVLITSNNQDSFTISNFNKIFSIIYEESESCADECIQIKAISQQLNAYKDLLNVVTLKIQNPIAYINSSVRNSKHKIMSNSLKFQQMISRLNKYLSHIRSTYNTDSIDLDTQLVTDVDRIEQLLKDIDKFTRTCSKNCDGATELLKYVEMFEMYLEHSYFRNPLVGIDNEENNNRSIQEDKQNDSKLTVINANHSLDEKLQQIANGNDKHILNSDGEKEKQEESGDLAKKILGKEKDFDFGNLLQRVLRYQSNIKAKYDI